MFPDQPRVLLHRLAVAIGNRDALCIAQRLVIVTAPGDLVAHAQFGLVSVSFAQREARAVFRVIVERLVEELSLDGQFHHDPAVVGKITPQTFAHDGRVASDRDRPQAGFGNGDVHDLVLIHIFGSERHLPARTTIGFEERLCERGLFLVHRPGGEIAEVIGAKEKTELRVVLWQPEENHFQASRDESALLR